MEREWRKKWKEGIRRMKDTKKGMKKEMETGNKEGRNERGE